MRKHHEHIRTEENTLSGNISFWTFELSGGAEVLTTGEQNAPELTYQMLTKLNMFHARPEAFLSARRTSASTRLALDASLKQSDT